MELQSETFLQEVDNITTGSQILPYLPKLCQPPPTTPEAVRESKPVTLLVLFPRLKVFGTPSFLIFTPVLITSPNPLLRSFLILVTLRFISVVRPLGLLTPLFTLLLGLSFGLFDQVAHLLHAYPHIGFLLNF